MAGEHAAEQLFPNDRYRFAIEQMLDRLYLGYDDVRALQFAQRAHAGYVAFSRTESGELADTLEQHGAALLANGRLVEAETALREAEHRNLELYGPADRATITDLGRLASALALQGRHDAARALLDERQSFLQTVQTDDARTALVVIRGRRLENEMLRGSVPAAGAYVGPGDPAALANPGFRDADVFLGYEAPSRSSSSRPCGRARRVSASPSPRCRRDSAWRRTGKPAPRPRR